MRPNRRQCLRQTRTWSFELLLRRLAYVDKHVPLSTVRIAIFLVSHLASSIFHPHQQTSQRLPCRHKTQPLFRRQTYGSIPSSSFPEHVIYQWEYAIMQWDQSTPLQPMTTFGIQSKRSYESEASSSLRCRMTLCSVLKTAGNYESNFSPFAPRNMSPMQTL